MRKMMQTNNRYIFVLLGLSSLFVSLSGCKNDKDQFLDALVSNDWQTAQAILDKHPDYIHLHVKSGGTLLHSAVYYDDKEMLEFLLKNGIDVNGKSQKDDKTPLHSAAIQGRCKMALLLIENGANVDARDELQCTPLHNAAMYSTKEMVELLISHGAEVDAKRDYFDRTPLYYACINRDEDNDALEVVETLLLHGADPNAPCSSDYSIIQSATVYPFCYFKKAQLLEDYGSKLEMETEEGTRVFTVEEYQKVIEDNREYLQNEYEKDNNEFLRQIGKDVKKD